MNLTFNDSLLRKFNTFVFPIAIVWSLMSLSGSILSNTSIEGYPNRYESFFELFRFGPLFGLTNEENIKSGKSITTTKLIPYPHRLKAILRDSSDSYVVLSDGKTSAIIRLNEWYKKQFQLTSLSDDSATFRGFGKTYRLRLAHEDNLVREERVTTFIPDPKDPNSHEWHTIERSILLNQLKDIENISKTIEITEVRNGANVEGFRVDSLASDSLFSSLGIMQGDVIQSINNKKLESYADALSIYNKVPQIRSLRISIIRNNLPKDILYEVTR